MPSCQKSEKESLMPLLFKVNENLGMLTCKLTMIFSDMECPDAGLVFQPKINFVIQNSI
jgi:hypothetical protein